MSFQEIAVVENTSTYLDIAFKNGKKRFSLSKERTKSHGLERFRFLEIERLRAIAESLNKSLALISDKFPNLDSLSEFYNQLIEETLDVEQLKKSLGATAWVASACQKMAREFIAKYRSADSEEALLIIKRQAIGRISSLMHQIKKELIYLKRARNTMRKFPTIKTGLFTVCIAGFPNVGKSTLLSKLTPANPKIRNYAFTTKSLNIGYSTYRHNKIQFIDTPGTLNRPKKMNVVEREAYLAMKYVANMIIYLYDPTETYPLSEQEALEKMVRNYGKKVIVYLSKTDVVKREIKEKLVESFLKKGLKIFTDVEEVKNEVEKQFKDEYM